MARLPRADCIVEKAGELMGLGIPQCGFHPFRHGNATLLDQIGKAMAVWQIDRGTPQAQTTMLTRTPLSQTNAELQMNLGNSAYAGSVIRAT
jgi:hypothetical protein